MTVRAETEVTLTRVNDGDNGVKVYDGTAGSVVTVSNASEYPALELVADIIPIQPNDYDSVWVGGAGKNKLPNLGVAKTENGVTFTPQSDGSVLVNGTASATATYRLVTTTDSYTLPAGTYIISGAKNSNRSIGWSINGYITYSTAESGTQFTLSEATTFDFIFIRIASGQVLNNVTFHPMIRLSSVSDSTWTPYENICPIYGHDHCDVVVSPTLLDTDGTTYTINFPQVVYGGTLDVVKGILTVTYDNIASYNGETLNGEWISDRDEYGGGTPPTTGAQVVYELDTPIVYKVSPMDIELISGTCNVWTSTGDITDFRYAEIAPATLETFGEARKVAVKYVTDMGDDGIIVHPENDTSNYAKINAEGMGIVKDGESIAFYGDISRVGAEKRSRTITSPNGISMYTDDNVLAFSIGSSVNTGSVSVNEWVNYYATLNTSSTLTVSGLSQGAVGGDIQLGITASYYDYNSVPNRQKTETNENIYFSVGTSATETWTVGASNDYTITITYDGSTSFTITNDIPITEQNYIRVAFVEYDKIDIIADVKLGSKTLSDGVWYTEARVVLWENESPKANFSAQTVSLGAVEQFNYCDELEITFINSVSGLRYGSARGPIDRVNYSDTHTILSQGAQTKLYSREVYFNYVGQVVFSNGNYDGTNGAQYCVPQKIIGIRHI